MRKQKGGRQMTNEQRGKDNEARSMGRCGGKRNGENGMLDKRRLIR